MTLPLTILGGYLGAGKTTLVNHLLRHADGVRLAVLVNEFGALPIDADLIEAQGEDIISIAGGCVCCSFGNDLTRALMDMAALDPPPDHVLLEASGVALPGAIAASVSLLQGYALDGIVVLADGETVEEQARDTYIGDTIARQLADADLVVLNKADLVPEGSLAATRAWLAVQAPGAEIVPARHGALPPETLLRSFLGSERPPRASSDHQADMFETTALPIAHPVDAHALARDLADAAPGLIRAKGFAATRGDGPVAVQVVGRRWTVSPAPSGGGPGLVVIGRRGALDTDAIRALIAGARTEADPTG